MLEKREVYVYAKGQIGLDSSHRRICQARRCRTLFRLMGYPLRRSYGNQTRTINVAVCVCLVGWQVARSNTHVYYTHSCSILEVIKELQTCCSYPFFYQIQGISWNWPFCHVLDSTFSGSLEPAVDGFEWDTGDRMTKGLRGG